MDWYLIRLTPPRPTFADDITEQESAVIGEHFAYLKGLEAAGRLKLAGRTAGAEVGIALILAETLEDAQAMLAGDPAIRAGVFTGVVHRFFPAIGSI